MADAVGGHLRELRQQRLVMVHDVVGAHAAGEVDRLRPGRRPDHRQVGERAGRLTDHGSDTAGRRRHQQ
ncbi:hypothetical protein [Streptomyces olivaceoviridis]|uniref:hypothetical protein n=1 Tax=Streptomyces olivaceoviridis TaxID=1921 RepID=UPI0036FA4D86